MIPGIRSYNLKYNIVSYIDSDPTSDTRNNPHFCK
jgi:hypothetical protein